MKKIFTMEGKKFVLGLENLVIWIDSFLWILFLKHIFW